MGVVPPPPFAKAGAATKHAAVRTTTERERTSRESNIWVDSSERCATDELSGVRVLAPRSDPQFDFSRTTFVAVALAAVVRSRRCVGGRVARQSGQDRRAGRALGAGTADEGAVMPLLRHRRDLGGT